MTKAAWIIFDWKGLEKAAETVLKNVTTEVTEMSQIQTGLVLSEELCVSEIWSLICSGRGIKNTDILCNYYKLSEVPRRNL